MLSIARNIHPRRPCGGFAMAEVMVAMGILTLCGYLMSATITATIAHSVVRQETAFAADAARNVLEDMRAVPFGQLFALYNESPDDDPDGPGSAPGLHFDIPALDPMPGDVDGFAGRILLPSPGPELFESSRERDLLMPRDLNGDGWADVRDHSGDYIVLPVQVFVEWNGYAGGRSFSISTLLAEMTRP